MWKELLIIFIFNLSVVNAESLPLTFHKLTGLQNHLDQESSIQHLKNTLTNYNHHHVQIRGFLYKTEIGEWILSSEPNLKSCCIGTSNKATKQIFLEGFTENNLSLNAVNFEGYFKIDPKWDSQGNLTQLYRLENAKILSAKEINFTQWILLALLLGVALLLFYYVPKMKIPEKDA